MDRQQTALGVLVGLVLIAAGCGEQNPAKPAATQVAADRAAIERVIALSPELRVDFSDDSGELLAVADPASQIGWSGPLLSPSDSGITATAPIHWGRRRIPAERPPTRTIEFVEPPDSGRALVRIVVQFDGWLYVDRTDDGLRNPGKKPLREKVIRYAQFRKLWFHTDSTASDSIYGWRLTALSPAEFTLLDAGRQTVHIESIKLTGAKTEITISDPRVLLNLRGPSGSLPAVTQGEVVKIEALVTNSDEGYRPAEFIYLHVPTNDRPFPGVFDRARIRMRDDGKEGDALAGDMVYTTLWTVRDVGRHHLAVDVLNSRTLQNETDDDYNSTTWGVPYSAYPIL